MNKVKQASEKIKKFWAKNEKPNKLDIALLVCLLAFCTLVFIYGDIKATLEHSFNFIDSIFSGRFNDFYQVAIENSTFGHPAVYDIPLYFIFALWNLPIYIIKSITGLNYLGSFPCLLWAKSLIILVTLMTAKTLFSVSKELGISKNKSKWIVFLFLSSTMLIIPNFVIVQYDIFSIYFSLLGILAYLKRDNRKFIFYFIIANTLKLFSVFIFIPLLLLREKKIINIIWKTAAGFSGVLLCKLLFLGNVAYAASTKSFAKEMLMRLQETGIEWNNTGFMIPFFFLVLFGVCIFAYAKKCETKEEENKFVIYLPLVIFYSFITFTVVNPYWMVLVLPYSVLIMFLTPRYLKLNLLLDAIVGLLFMLVSFIIIPHLFSNYNLSAMLLSKIVSPERYSRRFNSVSDFLQQFHFERYVNIVLGLLVISVIAILIINYPRKDDIKKINHEKVERGVVWLRASVPSLLVMLMCMCYLLPAKSIVLDSLNKETVNSEINILETGSKVEQIFEFDENLKIDEIKIGIDTVDTSWIDTSSIIMEFIDLQNNKSLYNKRLAVNTIEDGLAEFKTKGLKVKKNQKYKIQFTNQDGKDNPAYLKLVVDIDNYLTYVNGELISNDLNIILYGKAN